VTSLDGPRRLTEILVSPDPGNRDALPAVPHLAWIRFAVAESIEVFTNPVRLHSALGCQTPFQALTEYQTAAAAS
jgi:hypothetical protein